MLKTTLAAATLAVVLTPSFSMAFTVIHIDRTEAIGDTIADHHQVETPQIHNDQVMHAVNGAILGQAGRPVKGTQFSAKVKIGTILKCTVAGTPSEFPDDLRIANAGVVAIPAGTQVKWKAQGNSGIAALTQSLQPGKTLKLDGVLPGGVEAGTACSAKALGL